MSDSRDDAPTPENSPAPAVAENDSATDAVAAANPADATPDGSEEAIGDAAPDDEVEEVTVGGRGASLDDFPVTAADGTLVAESAAERAADEAASPDAPIAEVEGVAPFVETEPTAGEAPPGEEPAVTTLTAEQPEGESATAAVSPDPAAPTGDVAPMPVDDAEATSEASSEATSDATAESTAPGTDGPPSAEGPSLPPEPESGELLALRDAMEKNEAVEGQVIGWNKGGYHVALGRIAAFCPVSQIEVGNPRAPKKYLDRTFKFNVIEVQQGGRRVVVSRAAALKAEREARAREVKERFKPGAALTGKVSSLTDFGAFVDLGGGIEGLVHVSEISRRRVEHPKEMLQVGQEVQVEVLKVEKRGQRISLSMKRLEADPWEGVGERFASGDTFAGTILRKTEFGLFVEVAPGLEGLVHLSRLPHGTTIDSDALAVGNKVEGWVHDVEPKRRRLSLSLREVAKGNPWQGIADRFPVGSLVDGTVERLAPFGAFIELEPGVTGLLPFSAVASTGPGSNPKRQYHVGRQVKVKVLSIDRARKRISLGTEQSKAEGSESDYREYMKAQKSSGAGLGTLAAAFEKLKAQAEG